MLWIIGGLNMMNDELTDLVAELREHERSFPLHSAVCGRAADAIERLLAELEKARKQQH